MKIYLIWPILLATLHSCATKTPESANSARFAATEAFVEKLLNAFPPPGGPYVPFSGYPVKSSECSFMRTLYLELEPEPLGKFMAALNHRIQPDLIMGLEPSKKKNQTNPCSRVRLFNSMKEISVQGQKNKSDHAYLVHSIMGIAPDARAYQRITFYEKHLNGERVKSINPGFFFSPGAARELTDQELADWIVTTLYHLGWK